MVVDDSNCVTPAASNTATTTAAAAFYPIFIGAGGAQYHYNYGGTGIDRPAGRRRHDHRAPGRARTSPRRRAGTVSRGGLGVSTSGSSVAAAVGRPAVVELRRIEQRQLRWNAVDGSPARRAGRRRSTEQGLVYGIPGRGQGGVAAALLGRVGALRRSRWTRCSRSRPTSSSLHSMCLEAVEHVVTTERFRDFAHPRVALGGRRGVVAAQRPARLRPLRPALRRRRPGQAAGVQRRHPHHAAGGVDPAVALAAGRPPRRRPVELAAREARRALGRDRARGCPATRCYFTWSRGDSTGEDHVTVGYLQETAAEAGLDTDRAGDRGHRLGLVAGALRRPRRALHDRRSSSSTRGSGCSPTTSASTCSRSAARDAVARAAVEGAAVQQGAAGGAVGDVPRPPQPAARLPRPARDAHRVRPQAAARAGGRQHRDRRAGLGDADRRRVRRGGLRLPALRPAARVRRLPARAGRVDRRRHLGGPRHPRDRRAGHRRRRGLRSPPHSPRRKLRECCPDLATGRSP